MNNKSTTINFVIINDEGRIYLKTTIDKSFNILSLCVSLVDAEQHIWTKLASYGENLPAYTIEFQVMNEE